MALKQRDRGAKTPCKWCSRGGIYIWHGHSNCKYFVMPKSNVEFWQEKISRTIMRDNEVYEKLADSGWNVLTIWECQLKKNHREKSLEYLYYNIVRNIKE